MLLSVFVFSTGMETVPVLSEPQSLVLAVQQSPLAFHLIRHGFAAPPKVNRQRRERVAWAIPLGGEGFGLSAAWKRSKNPAFVGADAHIGPPAQHPAGRPDPWPPCTLTDYIQPRWFPAGACGHAPLRQQYSCTRRGRCPHRPACIAPGMAPPLALTGCIRPR